MSPEPGTANDAPPDPGASGAIRRLRAQTGQRYYLSVPAAGGRAAPVVVVVHGISRNAREHVRAFAPLAQQYGAVLVAPRFGRARFPDYQRLGRSGRGERADLALQRILAEVARDTGACTDKVFLFGFSGGGQFVHRFALAHPQRVAAYVVGAAGWYTFPDPQLPYPRGTRCTRTMPDTAFDLRAFLRVPATVLVGERDTDQGAALRKSTKVIEQQGASRVERGRRWVEAMKAACAERGLPDHFGYRTLPRSAHSFREAMRLDAIAELTMEALLGDRAGD
ncbi:MAG TPA: hypothetical protein VFX05_06115 [Casimicrobiaceae bacterium]|nr:hypothetical protein [Casimicrobiaceae bacterium]